MNQTIDRRQRCSKQRRHESQLLSPWLGSAAQLRYLPRWRDTTITTITASRSTTAVTTTPTTTAAPVMATAESSRAIVANVAALALASAATPATSNEGGSPGCPAAPGACPNTQRTQDEGGANEPADATLKSGRHELPAHARGVLVLADPPEAGWQMQAASDEQQSRSDADKLAAPESQRDGERAGLLKDRAWE